MDSSLYQQLRNGGVPTGRLTDLRRTNIDVLTPSFKGSNNIRVQIMETESYDDTDAEDDD